MATVANSLHNMTDGEPRQFASGIEVLLQLQYRINQDGEYEFSYRNAARAFGDARSQLARDVERVAWSPYLSRERFVSSLDIRIMGRDTVVQVETFGPHIFWSLTRDAITTLDDHSDLYGELRYLDGDRWVKREEVDQHFCRQIRFKAKFNSTATRTESHKFSYNVLLRDRFGDIVEYEIDPDIKNPSV
jgi:hypothetical protein